MVTAVMDRILLVISNSIERTQIMNRKERQWDKLFGNLTTNGSG